MKNMETVYTAESVTRGHPDKFCDAVSDAILDTCLFQDRTSRVACETFATKDLILVGGEITSSAAIAYEEIIRKVASDVGYDISKAKIVIAIHEQSSDIREAVNGNEQGAGDQGVMVGFACNETAEKLPIEYAFARRLTNRLEEVYDLNIVNGIRLDGKSQVSVRFVDGKFDCFTKIVVSIQHDENKDLTILNDEIRHNVIDYVFSGFDLSRADVLINPSGRFVLGGLDADTGLTGRKIVVDAYGPRIPVGGGAFSGKDPSKLDRAGAYYARYIAKNIVEADIANSVQVHLAYAIGKADLLAINIDTFGTEKYDKDKIKDAVLRVFDFKPASIIEQLSLLTPIYSSTAKGGHFVCSEYTWEKSDRVLELQQLVS